MRTKSTKNAAPKATKPPAGKPKKRDVDAKMIIETLNALKDAADDEKNGDGFAFITIKKYITKTYGLMMGKERLARVKEVMEGEYLNRKIKMMNHDGKINFAKRFDLASDA